MILDNIRIILKEYDFTDSIIVDIFSEKYFTKIILLIDYYWDIQEGRTDSRILKLTFDDCTNVKYRVEKTIVEDIRKGINTFSFYTIVKVVCKSDKEISIYNGITDYPIFEVKFNTVGISEK